MRKLLVTFVSLFVGLTSLSAQTYSFATLAGPPSIGNTDSVDGVARFSEPREVAVDHRRNVCRGASHLLVDQPTRARARRPFSPLEKPVHPHTARKLS